MGTNNICFHGEITWILHLIWSYDCITLAIYFEKAVLKFFFISPQKHIHVHCIVGTQLEVLGLFYEYPQHIFYGEIRKIFIQVHNI